jgi:glucokinase
MKEWVIGVDLGGTQIRAARVDRQGTQAARSDQLTHADKGGEAVMGRIFECVDQVLQGVPSEEIEGIGIGAPGPIDAEGRLHNPPNLPDWPDFSLSDRLSKRFGVPAFAGNDANVAALAERRFGAGKGVDDLVYVTVSTGIGGGIVSGGKLLVGARGYAAEIGHQTLVIDGPICGCGQPGHLEALASGPAIAREAKERIEQGAETSLKAHGDQLDASHVTRAAEAGDSLAIELLAQAGFYIGLGLVNLIHILEPARILIGGGVSQAGELLFKPIRETVHSHLMSPVFQSVEILPADLGADVGLLGAVALVLEGAD